MQTFSSFFGDIFDNSAEGIPKEVVPFTDHVRNNLLDFCLSIITAACQNGASLESLIEMNQHLFLLSSLFASFEKHVQVNKSKLIRPILLNLQHSIFAPILVEMQSSVNICQEQWDLFLPSLLIYWDSLYQVHLILYNSKLIRFSSFEKWLGLISFTELALFLGLSSSSNPLFTPFGIPRIDESARKIKSIALSFSILLLKISIKLKQKSTLRNKAYTDKPEFIHNIGKLCRLVLSSLITVSCSTFQRLEQLSPEYELLSLSLQFICLGSPMTPSSALPSLPISFISNLLIPLSQFESNQASDNPTDQLTHLLLLAQSPNKDPSLQGLSLFTLRSLSSSLDSFCSLLLEYIFSLPQLLPSSLLILSTLTPILKERKPEAARCVNLLVSVSQNAAGLDQLSLSCLLVCLNSFVRLDATIPQSNIISLLPFSLQLGALSRLTCLHVLTHTLSSNPPASLLSQIFPSLIQALNHPSFESEIPETISLLLPLSTEYFANSPNVLQSLLHITATLIHKSATSISPHTLNRLLTILRFCTEDPDLLHLCLPTFQKILPPLFSLLPSSPSLSEELFSILSNALSASPSIPSEFLSIFQFLLQVQKSNQNELTELVPVLNWFLFLSPSLFSSTDISTCLSMANSCIHLDPSQVFDPGFSRSHGYLLIALIMDCLRKDLEPSHISQIHGLFWSHYAASFPSCSTLSAISPDHIPLAIDSYHEQLLRIFLLGAYLYPKYFLNFSINEQNLENLKNIIDLIAEFTPDFESAYDRKILLLGLVSIFKAIYGRRTSENSPLFAKTFETLGSIFSKIIMMLKFFQLFDKFEEQQKLVNKRKKVFEDLEPLIKKCEDISDELGCTCDLRQSENPKNEHDMVLAAMLDPSQQKKKMLLRVQSRLFGEDEIDYLKTVLEPLGRNQNHFPLLRSFMCQVAFEFSDEILNSTQLVNISHKNVSKYRKIRTLKRRSK